MAQVKIAGAPRLLLDGLLVGRNDRDPDIVVEIKISKQFFPSNTGNRLAEAAGRLLRYRSRYGRPSVAWLMLLVIDQPITVRMQEKVMEAAAEYGDDVRVSLVSPDSLEKLSLPI